MLVSVIIFEVIVMVQDRRLSKLRQIIAIDNKLDAIFSSLLPLQEKRMKLRQHLTDTLLQMVDGKEKIPPLEWIVCRELHQGYAKYPLRT